MPTRGEKISAAKKGIATVFGPGHGMWKGDSAGYHAIHKWIGRNKVRTGVCEDCGRTPTRTHFANVSGDYKRDVNDYRELCGSCHKRFDGHCSPLSKRERDRLRLQRWRASNAQKVAEQNSRKRARRKGVMP